MFREHLHNIQVALLIRPANRGSLDTIIVQELRRSVCTVDRITFSVKDTARLQQVDLALSGTRRNKDVLLRNTVAYSDHSGKQSLVKIITDTTNLTCRAHIDTQYRIRFVQTGKRELGSLNADPVDIKRALVRFRIRSVEHDLRRCLDEITLQDFRYEWEAT